MLEHTPTPRSLPPPLTPSVYAPTEVESSMEEDQEEPMDFTMDPGRVVRLLASPPSEGTEELVIHPSLDDTNL